MATRQSYAATAREDGGWWFVQVPELVAAVGNGDEVVIAKRGKPVARLVRAVEIAPEHTAAQAAEWLTRNPVPIHPARTAAELDRQIASEREGWE